MDVAAIVLAGPGFTKQDALVYIEVEAPEVAKLVTVVVNEPPVTGGVTATIGEKARLHLEATTERINSLDSPFSLHALEDDYLPDATRVVDEVLETVSF